MEPTRYEDFHFAFRNYSKKHGRAAATQLLKSISGESDPAKVHEGFYKSFVDAAQGKKIRTAEDVTKSAAWKDVEKSTMHGHAKVFTGLK